MNAKRLTLSERAHQDANTLFCIRNTAHIFDTKNRNGKNCTSVRLAANAFRHRAHEVTSAPSAKRIRRRFWETPSDQDQVQMMPTLLAGPRGMCDLRVPRGLMPRPFKRTATIHLQGVAQYFPHTFTSSLHQLPAHGSTFSFQVSMLGPVRQPLQCLWQSLKQTGRSAFDVTGVRINSLRLLSAHPHWIVQHVGVDVQLIIGADRIRDDTALTGGT